MSYTTDQVLSHSLVCRGLPAAWSHEEPAWTRPRSALCPVCRWLLVIGTSNTPLIITMTFFIQYFVLNWRHRFIDNRKWPKHQIKSVTEQWSHKNKLEKTTISPNRLDHHVKRIITKTIKTKPIVYLKKIEKTITTTRLKSTTIITKKLIIIITIKSKVAIQTAWGCSVWARGLPLEPWETCVRRCIRGAQRRSVMAVVLWYCFIVLFWYCFIVLLWYCFIVLLWYCFIVLLWYCFIVLLWYCFIVLLWYCFIVLLWYCFIVLLWYCFIVLLWYCFIVLLWYCFIVLLWYCFIVLLWYCFITLLWYCFIVLLWYIFIVLLWYCFIVLLWYCFIVLLWYCFIVLLWWWLLHYYTNILQTINFNEPFGTATTLTDRFKIVVSSHRPIFNLSVFSSSQRLVLDRVISNLND